MNIDRRYTITPTTDAMINRTYNKSIRQTDILKEQKINVSTAAVPHYATGGQRDDTIEIVLIKRIK